MQQNTNPEAKKFVVYSRIDGESDKFSTLEEATKRADITAEQLREAGVEDTVTVWEESAPDAILYRGK